MAGAIPHTPEAYSAILTPIAQITSTGRLSNLSAWTFLLWDHVISLDREIEFFWTKPWSVAKGLYIFNRYASFLFLGIHTMIFLNPGVTDSVCLAWFKFEGYTGTSSIAAVELILAFRVAALWNRNKWVLILVGFALLGEITSMLSILSLTYVHMGAVAQILPDVPYRACIPFNIPPYFFAFWLPPLGYESLMFILATIKGYTTMRAAFKEFGFKGTGSRLIAVMMRDSFFYFFVIVCCDMVCSLIWLKGPDSLLQAVVGFGLAIPSVAGSHLLLNLREAYYHPTGETTFGRTYDLPTFGNKSANLTGVIGARRTKPGFELDTNWAMDPSLDPNATVMSNMRHDEHDSDETGQPHGHNNAGRTSHQYAGDTKIKAQMTPDDDGYGTANTLGYGRAQELHRR